MGKRGGERGARCWPCSTASPCSFLVLSLLLDLFLVGEGRVGVSTLNTTNSKWLSILRLEKIQRHLDRINKPAVRTIESPDGDIIDCVQWHLQPALDHPLLKNHKIQREPSQWPTFNCGRNCTATYEEGRKDAWQIWHHVGHCPEGTIPIQRSSVDDVLRAKSLYHFGKKQRQEVHEYAIAYRNDQNFYGAKAAINVWDPSVQLADEFSISQIWVVSGGSSDLNSVEAGWQVSPIMYRDRRPRLFIYWTSDGYKKTGCYNHRCSGFIQTNNKIALGAAISPVSSYGGSQFEITILIWKDPRSGNWWLSFGNNMPIGYWPAELFTHLKDRATMVQWGGEVLNSQPGGAHTTTQMGSGHFAEEGAMKASSFRNLHVVDDHNHFTSPQPLTTLASKPNCYNIQDRSPNSWKTNFYYGGPGKNPRCP